MNQQGESRSTSCCRCRVTYTPRWRVCGVEHCRTRMTRNFAAHMSDPKGLQYYVAVVRAQVLGPAPGNQRQLYPGAKQSICSVVYPCLQVSAFSMMFFSFARNSWLTSKHQNICVVMSNGGHIALWWTLFKRWLHPYAHAGARTVACSSMRRSGANCDCRRTPMIDAKLVLRIPSSAGPGSRNSPQMPSVSISAAGLLRSAGSGQLNKSDGQNLRHYFGTGNSYTRTLILDTIMKPSGTIGMTQKAMTFDTHACLILLSNPLERWGTHKKRWPFQPHPFADIIGLVPCSMD